MARPKKNAVPVQSNDTQELLDQIAQLKREKAELLQTQVDAKPEEALDYLKAIAGAIAANSGQANQQQKGPYRKPAGYGKPYVLTDARIQEVTSIFEVYAGRGIEYKFDKSSGSVTFRRKIKVRVYDKEAEQWVREDAWKSESVHCSSSDETINKIVKFLLLV